jgi:sarcosine oxidase
VRVEQAADLVVVGGGAMGLATAWHAAGPGRRVVVVERFALGHHRGASHGGERIFRHAHTERAYVDMALAADEGWQRLERLSGRRLIERVGCVEHGPQAELDTLARVSAGAGVVTEMMAAAEAQRRWPGLRFSGDVLFQPAGGWARAADALDVLASAAAGRGAELCPEEPVSGIDVTPGGVRVRTAGRTVVAPVVVVTAGAWVEGLVPGMALPPLTTTEEQFFLFRPVVGAGAGPRTQLPAFIHWDVLSRYGLPGPGGLVKVGEHQAGAVTTGDDRTFAVDPMRAGRLLRYVREWLPGLVPEAVDAGTCLYTTTASLDFVLDRVGAVVVGAGFSGLGFKYVPEVGRRLAAMAAGDLVPTAPFSLEAHATR